MSSKAFNQRIQERDQWSEKALATNLEAEKAGQIIYMWLKNKIENSPVTGLSKKEFWE